MEEGELRRLSLEWLKLKFAQSDFSIPLMVFHDEHVSLTEWLRRRFKGKELSQIPKYGSLFVEPDLVGLIDKSGINLWLIGECKVGIVGVGDLRQTLHYANTANAHKAFLILEGTLSSEVSHLIEHGEHRFFGINSVGKTAPRRLRIVEYSRNRFREISY